MIGMSQIRQHILPKQALEVTKEQFYTMFEEIVDRPDWARFHHKKVTIGKMIEFLLTQGCVYWKADMDSYSRVGLHIDGIVYDFREKELCNALWEATKFVLNRGKGDIQ